jgi:WD40 repeat protein
MWDAGANRRTAVRRYSAGWIVSFTFSPDGRYIAGASLDTTVRLWDVESGGLVATLQGHIDRVRSVAFAADGRYIASGAGSADGTVRLWEVRTGACLAVLEQHSGEIASVAFSPDGNQIKAYTGTGTRIWNIHTRQPVFRRDTVPRTGCTIFSPTFAFDSSYTWLLA